MRKLFIIFVFVLFFSGCADITEFLWTAGREHQTSK